MCDKYLLQYYRENLIQILKDLDEHKHFSLNINFVELSGNDTNLGNNFLRDPEKSLEEWDNALKTVQTNLCADSDENYIFKKHTHSRIYSLPLYPELHRTKFPQNDDTDKFLQVSGTVVRMTVVKMLEYQRQYICTKCKYVIAVNAEYDMKNNITPPRKCANPEDCKGTNIINLGELNPEFCKDYQEIKMQETVSKLDVGSMPNSMWVTLEDDLVDICKPGDNITVCGLVKRRQNPFSIGKKMDIELVMKANHIQVNNNHISALAITPELKDMFQTFWETYAEKPLVGRDIILKSICPQLFGLYIVKLAMAVVLAGGSNSHNNTNTGVRVRAEPHLLLVGDPGIGKSQLLRFASKIIPRSVLTTGVGSTAAGLTVTAVMENGEWQLEGGALVMADGGICCIDEFNTMKEHDRTSIHEAMEQQTISVAKASIVCKLSTRCSILAATNPKGNIDPSQPLNMNIALASPLLSRFDLILLLRDKRDDEWESHLVDYNFNSFDNCNSSKLTDSSNWTIETLQAYYAVIKKLQPVLTEDANRILSSYYQAQRRQNYRNKARTTVRLLDSLVRLSQGHARLMFHKRVEILDAVIAVILVETAVEADWSVFNLRFNLRNDFPHDPTSNYRELVEIVLKKLELNDLLEKELDVIDRKKPDDRPGPSNAKQDKSIVKKESKFFQAEKQNKDNKSDKSDFNNINTPEKNKSNEDCEDENAKNLNGTLKNKNEHTNKYKPNKDDLNQDDDDIIEKENKKFSSVKRAKSKSKTNSKKIKLQKGEDKVCDDLAALQYMPSVHDVFRMDNCEMVNDDDMGLNLKETDKSLEEKPKENSNHSSPKRLLSAESLNAKCKNIENKKISSASDVAALQYKSSVHDVFGMDNYEVENDKDIGFNSKESDKFVDETKENNRLSPNLRTESINAKSKNIENEKKPSACGSKYKNSLTENVLSQKTRTKNWFNKFRFVPHEDESPKNNDEKSKKSDNIFENSDDDITNISFGNVQCSTQQEKPPKEVKKFKFKTTTSSNISPNGTSLGPLKNPSSIFEDEDVNNLDLDF